MKSKENNKSDLPLEMLYLYEYSTDHAWLTIIIFFFF